MRNHNRFHAGRSVPPTAPCGADSHSTRSVFYGASRPWRRRAPLRSLSIPPHHHTITIMNDDICGAPCADDTPCQHPAGSCPIPSHSDADADNPGRPAAFDDERRQELVLTAVRAGLTVEDQAAHARVHPDTLRRRLCCVQTPSKPELTTDSPCPFCEDYVHAHGDGAIRVLEQCRPEFRASASFGYNKTEGREITGDDGGPLEIAISETVVETDYDDSDS